MNNYLYSVKRIYGNNFVFKNVTCYFFSNLYFRCLIKLVIKLFKYYRDKIRLKLNYGIWLNIFLSKNKKRVDNFFLKMLDVLIYKINSI